MSKKTRNKLKQRGVQILAITLAARMLVGLVVTIVLAVIG